MKPLQKAARDELEGTIPSAGSYMNHRNRLVKCFRRLLQPTGISENITEHTALQGLKTGPHSRHVVSPAQKLQNCILWQEKQREQHSSEGRAEKTTSGV